MTAPFAEVTAGAPADVIPLLVSGAEVVAVCAVAADVTVVEGVPAAVAAVVAGAWSFDSLLPPP